VEKIAPVGSKQRGFALRNELHHRDVGGADAVELLIEVDGWMLLIDVDGRASTRR